jgi:uncharacterized membrane protein
MSLSVIHGGLSRTALLFTLILAVWGLWRFLRKQGVDPSYSGALAIAEILFVIQAILGGLLYLTGEVPARGGVHVLYGMVGILAIPAAFVYTKGGNSRREMLIYALLLLFLFGISLRAIGTGG